MQLNESVKLNEFSVPASFVNSKYDIVTSSKKSSILKSQVLRQFLKLINDKLFPVVTFTRSEKLNNHRKCDACGV